jgi:LuxR family maltose regulon positive regulatory protein
MFTDIVGYTALMQQNERKAIQTRDKHRKIFNSVTEKYAGKILQYYGDGTLSIFDSAINAVDCGIEMQLGFQEQPAVPVRIGIHIGDIILRDEEIIGDSVNIASRIESLAVPGSVFISDKVYDEIKNQESIKTSLLKSFKLKNVKNPIKVYAISNTGLIVPKPDTIEGKTDPTQILSPQKTAATGSEKGAVQSYSNILKTKLYMPPPRTDLVHRSRLTERLNQGIKGKLTLISAPPGFGKTTLTSEWLTDYGEPVAWLSLDEGDNDPHRFLEYLIAAMQTVLENIGEGNLELFQLPDSPSYQLILTRLLNEIATYPDTIMLVLDDYHVIKTNAVHDLLTFLLDHLPNQMHVVMTTREDPDLPLSRLRVLRELNELGPVDLRFTPSEAAGFLNQVMNLNLSEDDIATLENRTEGWIAGLQLAALSLQRKKDISSFIKDFAGDDRYIIDYLAGEVLENQSENVRNFLLQTSILTRLNGSLCNEVTGRNDGIKMLDNLDRGNLFVIPLDEKRQWYRYHHLFADVLYSQLMAEQPDLVTELHQNASKWYQRNNQMADAIHHALKAKNFVNAADLIELAWPIMDESFQSEVWLDWAKALPDDLIHNRPILIVGYAWALLDSGEIEAGMALLEEAEQLLDTIKAINKKADSIPSEIIIKDKEQFRFLPATIATARSYHAQVFGDNTETVKYAREALQQMPEGDHIRRGTPTMLLGIASWASGDLEVAYQSMAEGLAVFQKAGNIHFAVSGTFILADIRITQGRLNEALKVYHKSLQLAQKFGDSLLPGTAEIYLGLSDLYREKYEMVLAREFLQKSEEVVKQTSFTQFRFCLSQARIYEAKNDYKGALEQLEEAERLYIRNPIPDVRPIAAMKARIWLKQNKIAEALNWAKENDLNANSDINYLREFELITFVRILLAEYNSTKTEKSILDALKLMERLLTKAENGKRIGSVIEIQVLMAIAIESMGNIDQALLSLERALSLAESEGYVQIFLAEGIKMKQLLSRAADKKIMLNYSNKLLSIIESKQNQKSIE